MAGWEKQKPGPKAAAAAAAATAAKQERQQQQAAAGAGSAGSVSIETQVSEIFCYAQTWQFGNSYWKALHMMGWSEDLHQILVHNM